MAAKTEVTLSRVLTVDGEVLPGEYKTILLDELHLSPRNPRIRRLLRKNPQPTDKEIQQFLLSQDGVDDLQRQIRENGGLVEPIIVDQNGEVIEGNCRLAIYRALKDGRKGE